MLQEQLRQAMDETPLSTGQRLLWRFVLRCLGSRAFALALAVIFGLRDGERQLIRRTVAAATEEYWSVDQAAEYLGVLDVDVYEMVVNGELPAYRMKAGDDPQTLPALPLRFLRSDVTSKARPEPIPDPADVYDDARILAFISRPVPYPTPQSLKWLLPFGGVAGVCFLFYALAGRPWTMGLFTALLTVALLVHSWALLLLLRVDYSARSSQLWVIRLVGAESVSLLLYASTVTVLLSVQLFASAYWLLARVSEAAFSERLTHVDALYFTITTFTTTGYGDIQPLSQLARLLASVQMLLTFLLVTIVVAMIFARVTSPDANRFRRTMTRRRNPE